MCVGGGGGGNLRPKWGGEAPPEAFSVSSVCVCVWGGGGGGGNLRPKRRGGTTGGLQCEQCVCVCGGGGGNLRPKRGGEAPPEAFSVCVCVCVGGWGWGVNLRPKSDTRHISVLLGDYSRTNADFMTASVTTTVLGFYDFYRLLP